MLSNLTSAIFNPFKKVDYFFTQDQTCKGKIGFLAIAQSESASNTNACACETFQHYSPTCKASKCKEKHRRFTKSDRKVKACPKHFKPITTDLDKQTSYSEITTKFKIALKAKVDALKYHSGYIKRQEPPLPREGSI